jgi:hypothetical protein
MFIGISGSSDKQGTERFRQVVKNWSPGTKDGDLRDSVYDKANAMLLNEIKKLHRESESQKR